MAWFYRFKPEDVNALTAYQLQGYLRGIIELQKLLSGVKDGTEPGEPPMTDEELKQELDKYQEAARGKI